MQRCYIKNKHLGIVYIFELLNFSLKRIICFFQACKENSIWKEEGIVKKKNINFKIYYPLKNTL